MIKNSDLLLITSDRFLSAIDRQRRFVIHMNNVKMPCPNCSAKQNVFEATGVAIDDYNSGDCNEKPATCISCKRGLEYVVPLIKTTPGGWKWRLIPETNDL